ncbi:MAG: sigma-70 family RNA polymerase sigma factor [Chloroflexota bacterium]
MTALAVQAIPRTDLELVEAITRQDEASLAELYDRYRSLCYALALRVVHDQGRAEDVVQDAFLAVWRKAGSYTPGRGSVRTWLTSVVRNRAIDIVRARRESTADDEPTLLAIRDPRPPVEEQVALALDAEMVRTVLADLPHEQRHVISLAFFGGHSHAEIAEETATPLGTVKSRIRLGMQRMRAGLGRSGYAGA